MAETDAEQVTIEYPSELPELLKLSDLELARELPFLAAAKLYEMGRLSSGKAARLAGMDRTRCQVPSNVPNAAPRMSAPHRALAGSKARH